MARHRRSDRQRRAMFARMNNPNGKALAKRTGVAIVTRIRQRIKGKPKEPELRIKECIFAVRGEKTTIGKGPRIIEVFIKAKTPEEAVIKSRRGVLKTFDPDIFTGGPKVREVKCK